jgi:hypothetical protein
MNILAVYLTQGGFAACLPSSMQKTPLNDNIVVCVAQRAGSLLAHDFFGLSAHRPTQARSEAPLGARSVLSHDFVCVAFARACAELGRSPH